MVMSGFVELPKMSRKVRQFSIIAAWTVFVVVYVWAFHIEPPHDDEYGKWLFASLFGAAARTAYGPRARPPATSSSCGKSLPIATATLC